MDKQDYHSTNSYESTDSNTKTKQQQLHYNFSTDANKKLSESGIVNNELLNKVYSSFTVDGKTL